MYSDAILESTMHSAIIKSNRVANEPCKPWKILKNPGKEFLKKSLRIPGNFIDPWTNLKNAA